MPAEENGEVDLVFSDGEDEGVSEQNSEDGGVSEQNSEDEGVSGQNSEVEMQFSDDDADPGFCCLKKIAEKVCGSSSSDKKPVVKVEQANSQDADKGQSVQDSEDDGLSEQDSDESALDAGASQQVSENEEDAEANKSEGEGMETDEDEDKGLTKVQKERALADRAEEKIEKKRIEDRHNEQKDQRKDKVGKELLYQDSNVKTVVAFGLSVGLGVAVTAILDPSPDGDRKALLHVALDINNKQLEITENIRRLQDLTGKYSLLAINRTCTCKNFVQNFDEEGVLLAQCTCASLQRWILTPDDTIKLNYLMQHAAQWHLATQQNRPFALQVPADLPTANVDKQDEEEDELGKQERDIHDKNAHLDDDGFLVNPDCSICMGLAKEREVGNKDWQFTDANELLEELAEQQVRCMRLDCTCVSEPGVTCQMKDVITQIEVETYKTSNRNGGVPIRVASLIEKIAKLPKKKKNAKLPAAKKAKLHVAPTAQLHVAPTAQLHVAPTAQFSFPKLYDHFCFCVVPYCEAEGDTESDNLWRKIPVGELLAEQERFLLSRGQSIPGALKTKEREESVIKQYRQLLNEVFLKGEKKATKKNAFGRAALDGHT